MAKWISMQHVHYEYPALIRRVARERGEEFLALHLYDDDPIPTVDEADGFIVMGGPMNAFEDEDYPWLPGVRSLLADALEAGKPVLGVCLGAQLLAAAAGAKITRGGSPEVGIGEVEILADDPVLGPAGTIPVLHWHEDTFAIPEGAERLASSSMYPNQAFRIGRAYGLQFHVELDPELAAALKPKLPDETELDPDDVARVEENGRGVIGRFFDLAVES